MELDTNSYILEEYLNSNLNINIQKLIFKYNINNIFYLLKNNEFNMIDLYLRRIYEITYLTTSYLISNNFNSYCIHNNNTLIINFKNNNQLNNFYKLLSSPENSYVYYNIKISQLTNYGKSLILKIYKQKNNFRYNYQLNNFYDILLEEIQGIIIQ